MPAPAPAPVSAQGACVGGEGSWVQRKRLSLLQCVFFKADPERVLKRFLLMASLQHSSNAPAFTVHIWFLLCRAISEGYKNAATKTHRRSMALVRGSRQRGRWGGGGKERLVGGAPDPKL